MVRIRERRNSPKYHQDTRPQMVNERTRQVMTFKRTKRSRVSQLDHQVKEQPTKYPPTQWCRVS